MEMVWAVSERTAQASVNRSLWASVETVQPEENDVLENEEYGIPKK